MLHQPRGLWGYKPPVSLRRLSFLPPPLASFAFTESRGYAMLLDICTILTGIFPCTFHTLALVLDADR